MNIHDELYDACLRAVKAMEGIPEVGQVFDVQHSNSLMRALIDLREALAEHEGCESCCDSDPGIFPGNDNGYPVPEGWQGVERCDRCERYDDDVTAAIAYCRNHGLKEVRILLDRASGFTTTVPSLDP